jgi:hypothetical protein
MHHARTRLTDAAVRALPLAGEGQYIVRDTELPGFFVVVGTRTKTYTIQTDAVRGSKAVAHPLPRSRKWSGSLRLCSSR